MESLGPGGHLFESSELLWPVRGLKFLNTISPPYHLARASHFPLNTAYFFVCGGSNIFKSMVVQQRTVVLEFSQEKMSARPSTLQSYATNIAKDTHRIK